MLELHAEKTAIGETKTVISMKLDEEKKDEMVEVADQRFRNIEYTSLKLSNSFNGIIGLFIYGGSC